MRSNSPVKVGIAGCGNVVEFMHAPAYLRERDRIVVTALADPSNPAAMERIGELLGVPVERRFDSAEEMFAAGDLDAVDICTPPVFRPALVVKALDAKLAVLAEKPLAVALEPLEEVRMALERSGGALGTVHNHLEIPEFVVAREVAQSGRLGQVDMLVLNRLSLWDTPGTAGYQPNWRHTAKAGGGVLLDFMHIIYVIESILGARIGQVSAMTILEGAIERAAMCMFRTTSHVAAVNIAWGVGSNSLEIRGTEGHLKIDSEGWGDDTPPRAVLTTLNSRTEPEIPRPPTTDFSYTLSATLRNFAAFVDEGAAPIADFGEGRHALEVVLAAYKSAATDRSVSLPLDADDPVFKDGIAALTQAESPAGQLT